VRASHNFADVPDNVFFHAFVQFLVDNGITAGCAPGLFCGEDPVTRGQMAVFLKKLADLVDQDVAGQTATLQAQITVLQTAAGTTPCMRRVGTNVIFEGCNVFVLSGTGATDAPVNGLGNLIIGYNEPSPGGGITEFRGGSHNLVVGRFHTYSSYGGFVAGSNNAVTEPAASVSGGSNNTASGNAASVSGGGSNTASGIVASVSGGSGRSATGNFDWVAGGLFQDQ
jgi:hypothetical protein